MSSGSATAPEPFSGLPEPQEPLEVQRAALVREGANLRQAQSDFQDYKASVPRDVYYQVLRGATPANNRYVRNIVYYQNRVKQMQDQVNYYTANRQDVIAAPQTVPRAPPEPLAPPASPGAPFFVQASAGPANLQVSPGGPVGVQVSAGPVGVQVSTAPTAPPLIMANEPATPFAPEAPALGEVAWGSSRYLPTMPQISQLHRSTQPCMFEHRIGKGPGFWKWKCDRAGQPGVKKCYLKRVEKDQSTLVPMNCMQEYVNVLKGYDVRKTTTVGPQGQTITRQYVTPEVAVVGNVRKLGPAGPGIPVRMTAEQKAKLDADAAMRAASPYGQLLTEGETIMFGGRGAGRNAAQQYQQMQMQHQQLQQQQQQQEMLNRAAGVSRKSLKQQDAATNVGGQYVRLPSRTAVRKEVQFGPDDIQNFELGSIPGVMKQPEAWADLPAIGQNEIAFYAHDDSYGTTNNRHRMYGFTFSFRHLPYAYMTQQAYLEWLVSLSYRLRHEWSQYHNHVYDPLKDTIATVESYILTTLGRLEKDDKFFNRREMFAGAGEFRNVMHPILAAYAFRPPQRTWYSPLSARYLDGATGTEALAVDNVERMARAVVSLMADPPLGVTEVITLNNQDAQVMAIMEDTLVALLARLQFLHGYVVNTYYQGETPIAIRGLYGPDGELINGPTTMTEMVRNGLLTIGVDGQRRYLTKELARYLEMFQLDDEPAVALHYLPALRLRQAQQQGLVLPKVSVPAPGAVAPLGYPMIPMVPPSARPDEYQTIVTPPATTNVIVPIQAAIQGGSDRQQPQQLQGGQGQSQGGQGRIPAQMQRMPTVGIHDRRR
jgi:hypothetical protein